MSDELLKRRLIELSASAALNRWMGLAVTKASSGEVEIEMPWRDEAGQYVGFLHASLVAGLIDTACGFAAFTQVGNVLAAHISVNCLAPVVGARFLARGFVVRAGKRQIFTRGELFSAPASGERKLVANGEVLLMRADA